MILAGGSGTRFWPVSRRLRPKQFLSLVGGRPLLRQAFDRAAAMSGAERVFVSAGETQWDEVARVLPELPRDRFIGEPIPRNTGPGVGLSALAIARIDPESVMVMTPADHVYRDEAALAEAIGRAVEAARASDSLVTLGIRPHRPETGYGYIETAAGSSDPSLPAGVLRAARFVEKPDAPTARRYVEAGTFLWNSGIFVWRARTILEAMAACAPDLREPLRALAPELGTPREREALGRAFQAMPSISIDYAVLEKAPRVLVVPADPGWSDVGSWDAVAELHAPGAEGNAQGGEEAEVAAVDATDCFVFRDGGPQVVGLAGVEGLIVVVTPDAVLVCRKERSQQVRAVVEALARRGRGDRT